VLGASNYTYAGVTWTRGLRDWISSHVRAFEFFQGCTRLVVPDNWKSGVKQPCYYEPELNPTYHDLAVHYGVGILPARPYHVLAILRNQLSPHSGRGPAPLAGCGKMGV
jgi:transposase